MSKVEFLVTIYTQTLEVKKHNISKDCGISVSKGQNRFSAYSVEQRGFYDKVEYWTKLDLGILFMIPTMIFQSQNTR